MSFVTLVLRSALRNRRRTFLTVGGIALSVFVISALLSVEGGFSTLFDSTGDSLLNVHEKGIACPFTGRVFDSYIGTVAATPNVVAATGVLRGLYSFQSKDNLVVVSGVDFDEFRRVKRVTLIDGSESEFAAKADAALIGKRVAGDHGWRVGQTVSLLEDRLTFQVAGIFESDDKSYEGGVLLHKDFLANLKRDQGRSTYLIVAVNDANAIPAVSRSIDTALANYPTPTTTQSERAAKEKEMKDFLAIRRMLSAMLLATIVVSVLGAANSVSMSVRERTREVGILRSIGLRRVQILLILLGESALSAAAGGALGVAAAALFLTSAKSLAGLVPLVLGPGYALAGMGIALLVGLLGAIVPGTVASRIRIVDALRLVD